MMKRLTGKEITFNEQGQVYDSSKAVPAVVYIKPELKIEPKIMEKRQVVITKQEFEPMSVSNRNHDSTEELLNNIGDAKALLNRSKT